MTWAELIAEEKASSYDGVAYFDKKPFAKRFMSRALGLRMDVVATQIPNEDGSITYKIYNLDVPSTRIVEPIESTVPAPVYENIVEEIKGLRHQPWYMSELTKNVSTYVCATGITATVALILYLLHEILLLESKLSKVRKQLNDKQGELQVSGTDARDSGVEGPDREGGSDVRS